MNYGLFAVIIALLGLMGACIWLCVRTRAACDAVILDNQRVIDKITHISQIAESAKSIAQEAQATAKSLYLEHYEKLAARVASISGEAAAAVNKSEAVKESLRDLSMKWEQRLRRAGKVKEKPADDDDDDEGGDPENSETDPFSAAVKNGQAIPLTPMQPIRANAPVGPGGRFGFGEVAKTT